MENSFIIHVGSIISPDLDSNIVVEFAILRGRVVLGALGICFTAVRFFFPFLSRATQLP